MDIWINPKDKNPLHFYGPYDAFVEATSVEAADCSDEALKALVPVRPDPHDFELAREDWVIETNECLAPPDGYELNPDWPYFMALSRKFTRLGAKLIYGLSEFEFQELMAFAPLMNSEAVEQMQAFVTAVVNHTNAMEAKSAAEWEAKLASEPAAELAPIPAAEPA